MTQDAELTIPQQVDILQSILISGNCDHIPTCGFCPADDAKIGCIACAKFGEFPTSKFNGLEPEGRRKLEKRITQLQGQEVKA